MSLPTQVELQALLSYDPETGTLIWKQRPYSMFPNQRVADAWNTRYANKPAFTAVDKKGYLVGSINDTSYRAARVIYKMYHGVDAEQVDHVDGNRTNNRIQNLRSVTGQQNQQNMKRCSRNTSGVTGVFWNQDKDKWTAKIGHNRKLITLGHFDRLEDAVKARKDAEVKYGFHPNHGRDS